ncbi:MAG TPA: 50S ribosomal protein L24 [Acidimicrobiales bacterium]|jgi:large subunit ribosomal protein L24|nr:50S ribosomal protein L24 [Acidimicrobiales bacterium]
MAPRKPQAPGRLRLRKGDKVRVLSGKDRGREGVVMRALPAEGKVVVENVNVVKRHTRPTRGTMQGGIIDKDMPLPASKVAIVCPEDGPTRIGMRVDDQGRKVRVCRKCGGDL